MLSVENFDLHYGAAIALRQVSLTAEIGAVTAAGRMGLGRRRCWRAIVARIRSPRGRSSGSDDITACRPTNGARRGIAWVPQGRDIFPLLTCGRIWKPALRAAAASGGSR